MGCNKNTLGRLNESKKVFPDKKAKIKNMHDNVLYLSVDLFKSSS